MTRSPSESVVLPRCWLFVAVAMGWTWCLGFASAASGGPAGRLLHLIALIGPLVALGVVLGLETPSYRRDLLRRVLDVRLVRPVWWAAVVAVGAGPALIGAGVAAALGRTATLEPGLTAAGFTGAAIFAIAAGLMEEPGWRGVALDGSVGGLGLARSSLALGVLWSLWHLPLYFIEGTFQHDLGVGTTQFWTSMLVRVPLAVLLVLLVVRTQGMVVAAVAAHALGNTVGELLDTGVTASLAELAITCLAAVVVLLAWSRAGRATGWEWRPDDPGRLRPRT